MWFVKDLFQFLLGLQEVLQLLLGRFQGWGLRW
jgi:hypothetical protein